MHGFDHVGRTRILFGSGGLDTLGEVAREMGFRHALLVADPGLVASGHAAHAAKLLRAEDLDVTTFHDFGQDPDSAMVEKGAVVARAAHVDSLVALGGGSSLDCAKGINFLVTNGGQISDYRGYGKATRPLLPMIGVPTTAGTGSEAQSYALISDVRTHEKMACGDPGAAFRVALLDAKLTLSQPREVTATAGYDAISHAVESYVCTRRNPISALYGREAFKLLDGNLERALDSPKDLEAREAMLLGAHLAGMAIEASMLGATHACANPVSARHGATHGVAVGLFLVHVVRWNSAAAGPLYAELLRASGRDPGADPAAALAERLEALAAAAQLPRRLREAGVEEAELPSLAESAGGQWTGKFNPRPFDAAGALELYRAAL
jgi:alcohol dehydrogenase